MKHKLSEFIIFYDSALGHLQVMKRKDKTNHIQGLYKFNLSTRKQLCLLDMLQNMIKAGIIFILKQKLFSFLLLQLYAHRHLIGALSGAKKYLVKHKLNPQ